MAARAMGSREGRVTACESYLPMVTLMKKVLRLNGMEGTIKVINKRSDELQVGVDIPSRAHVLVSTKCNCIKVKIFLFFYHCYHSKVTRVSLDATVKLLHCEMEVMDSNSGKSLSACRDKAA